MIETETKAEIFQLRTPLLSKGRLDTVLAETDIMRVWLKTYANGGENVLHAHPGEDHTFVILQGHAKFYDKAGTETVLGHNQGIMLPRGVHYYFQSCGEEPLVMLRVGAFKDKPPVTRIGGDGSPLPAYSKENKHEDPVVIEGAFYE